MKNALVLWFHEVTKADIGKVGGKGANLGEMTRAGFPVPPGFIVTADAYYQYIQENHLNERIEEILNAVVYEDQTSLEQASKRIKQLLLQGNLSEQLTRAITSAYAILSKGQDLLVAVRSSATAEDLPTASFAGQQETFLNVKGKEQVLQHVKLAWASLFGARAMFYRHENQFDHLRVGIAIPIERMIESDASGVMFTIDPVTNDQAKIVIEAIYGLGEMIVQGEITPDHYEVDKKTLAILSRSIAKQTIKLMKQEIRTEEVSVELCEQHLQKITDEEILSLARLGKQLEKHYHFPQDIEWAIEQGQIYLVQTRPVTTLQEKKQQQAVVSLEALPLLLAGDPASPGIACGPARILHHTREIERIEAGDVLVAPQTNPDFVPAMKKVVAVVTDLGGRTSHAAIVSREIGIPAVVGTTHATQTLMDGMMITVDGTTGKVYQGRYIQQAKEAALSTELLKTKTKVYVNLAEPEFAERVAKRHVDGVGLLRAEFMMATIGKHPRQFIEERQQDLFVAQLASGLETFCQVFAPRPVVYRTSDLKTNEYRDLVGGNAFEPEEPNPMLGFRGAFRYIKDEAVFQLELAAIKQVRKKNPNLWLMLPFVRTVDELIAVKQLIAASGLEQSETFKLWMMVEIPSNVILLDDFIDVGIDGVSIGSNDLTMLLLGTDRDNSLVAQVFNEQNKAVLWALERVITRAKARGITSSLCGQAASQYPELVKKLITWGITSVSVSPDVIDATRSLIARIESGLAR